jgi:thiol:disulfide interchange protein
MSRYLIILLALLLLVPSAFADEEFVRWSARMEPADARAGEHARVVVTAEIDDKWYIYAIEQPPVPDPNAAKPRPASIRLYDAGVLQAAGDAIEPPSTVIRDDNFGFEVAKFVGEVSFGVPVQIAAGAAGPQQAIIEVSWQACRDGLCDAPKTIQIPVEFEIAPGEARGDRLAALTDAPDQPAGYVPPSEAAEGGAVSADIDPYAATVDDARKRGLFAFMGFAFLMGLAALLTPCVWPMIPITVSYFTKVSEKQARTDYRGAFAYCFGIIGTFTLLGLLLTLIFGAAGIQVLATSPYVNLAIAGLFIVLALNLFGVYEITVPSWIVNKTSAGSRQGGLIGPILMGLTFSLTTFTCTVPFVGFILAGAATGDALFPTFGMIGFSAAFAIPFFGLAIFPQYMQKMPKSGNWLASTKVYMGFLELAAAVKFLSNADLVWGLGLLTREVFLAIWAILAFFAGCYLFGWIRLGHEPMDIKIGNPRRGLGFATIVAGVFCLLGLQGTSLGTMSAFLPPDPYPGRERALTAQRIPWVHDYQSALAMAKEQNRPMFINFTGVTCTNCREMEGTMFPRDGIASRINNFIPVELYTDRGTPEDEANKELERKLTGTVTLPVYVIVTPDEKPVKIFQGSTRSEADFAAFLDSGWAAAGGQQLARSR